AFPQDALYQRGQQVRKQQSSRSSVIRQAAYFEPAPAAAAPPAGAVPPLRLSQLPVPGAPPPGQRALLDAPGREFSIVPRTSGGFNPQSFAVNGETAIVITGGVILLVRTIDGSGLLDIEADKLVFWTKGSPQELLGNLSSQRGQRSRELEFYMSGNV